MDLGNLNSNGRSMSLMWIIAAGLAIILGGLLIASFTPAIFPTQGSTQAQQVDNLFRFMLAIGGSIFLLVNGVLLYSVIRFRARKGDNSDGPPIHGNTTLEFTWTVIPAVIVAGPHDLQLPGLDSRSASRSPTSRRSTSSGSASPGRSTTTFTARHTCRKA